MKQLLIKLSFQNNRISGFNSWVRAGAHICDHLLTPPEAKSWCALVRWLKPIIESRSGFETAKRLWSENGDGDFQRLYDAYMAVVILALASSEGEGWYGREEKGNGIYVFGINGVLTILEGCAVVTAYIPGAGSGTAIGKVENLSDAEEIARRRNDPLPRLQPAKRAESREECELDDREKLSQIFRKAAKSVRRRGVNWYIKDMRAIKRLSLEEWTRIYDKYASRNEEQPNGK